MKTCSKCKKEKELSEFYFKNKNKGTRQNYCKSCEKEYSKNHYLNNKQDYLDRSLERRKRVISSSRQKLWEYLSNSECTDCGENNPIVLEFDHIENNKKDSVCTLMNSPYSWKIVLEEINKCEVVCANCHKIRTAQRDGWWRLRFYEEHMSER